MRLAMGHEQPRQKNHGDQRPRLVHPPRQARKIDELTVRPIEQAQRFIKSAVDTGQFRHQATRKHE